MVFDHLVAIEGWTHTDYIGQSRIAIIMIKIIVAMIMMMMTIVVLK